MFAVQNAKGNRVAEFENRSELDTYLQASYPDWQRNTFDVRDENNFAIANERAELLATVTGPAPVQRKAEPRPESPPAA